MNGDKAAWKAFGKRVEQYRTLRNLSRTELA
jgi:hypothetical protein